MFVFTARGYWHSAKLKSTFFPVWSSANGQQSILKALLNDRFLPIPLDGKKRGDRCSLGGAKVGGASFKDAFLIIPLHYLSLCFQGTGVGVLGENHVEKGGGDDLGRVDNPDTSTDTSDRDDTDGGANNPGTDTEIPATDNKDGKADKPSTSTDTPATDNTNGETDDPGTGTDTPDTDNTDGEANNTGTGTDTLDADADGGVDDIGTRTADANKQVVASNKAHASLFSLRKALFFFSLLLNWKPSLPLRHPHLFPYCL